MEENFSPVDPEVYEEKPIKTAADRFRETVNMPDFGIPEIQTNDEIFKQAPTPIPLDIAHKLVDGAKIREDVGEQTAVAVENALTGIGGFGDQAILAFGQLTNAVTGNALGTDFMETATKNLEMRMEDMQYAEDSVGGVRNLVAQLAGGAVSMGELLLVSAATGGMGGYVQMGVQAFGEGAFNDMEKYKAEHDGSLKGYEPKSADVAINAGNAILQAVIERKFGVSSPRFFVGASRGLIGEGASGFLQEASQSALADLAEYAKGNKEVAGWLDDAEGWIRDGIVGGLLQGGLGAATYNYNHNNAIKFVAKARAQSQGRETPNKEDSTFAKNIVNAKERGYASVLANEFKAAFDANTGEGKLQAKIAKELNRAAKELDLDTADETEMAQRIEQIATQETLNAMDFAREQNRLISDIELNNIVYKEGALWLEGLTPEVGDKAVSYARVLAERQSGLVELKTRIDANAREIQQLKADLAEAKAQKQESRAQVLQARIDKQNAIAEKNRLQAQKLEAQTAKLEKQIAKQTEQVKVAEPVKTEKVSAEEAKPVEKPAVKEPVKMAEVKTKKTKPVAEKKSLKQERANKKKTLTREQVIENMTNGSDRFLKIIIPTEGNSFIAANKETLDKIDMFARADFLQRAVANDKTTPDMIGEIFNFVENMPQGNYLSNIYYDIMVKPTTPTDVALKAKDKYNLAMVDSTTQEDWAGKTASEIATEKIKTVFGVFQSEIKKYEKKGVITDTDAEEKDADFAQIGSELLDKELLEYIFMKYNFDPRVIEWVRDNPNLLENNEEQEDSWEIGSGSNLVDILGEPLDYAPDGLKQIDIYDEKEPEFDYEQVVYKMPQTQEEFENKIVSAMYKQTAKGLDLQETELQDATPNDDRTPFLFQGSISGKGDTKRGGYDEELKRIILKDGADLSTIQHEFAHYWMQNNFKWARSGLASQDWLRRWRDVEEWLGIEPQDRLLSKSASEKFAKAYERYILEGKVAPELQWAFEGFQKAYQDIYDDLENEYFDLSEELAPEVVDWFNRQRPITQEQLKERQYKQMADIAMAAGAEVVTPVSDGSYVVSSMSEDGEVQSDIVVPEQQSKQSKLAQFRDEKKKRSVIEGLKKSNKDIKSEDYNVLNRAKTIDEAKSWIERDRAGAWSALNDENTNIIDRTALFEAFKQVAENGDPALGLELSQINLPKYMTEVGQAVSLLGEQDIFDPLSILKTEQDSLGQPSQEELQQENEDLEKYIETELTEEQAENVKKQTECEL